MQTINIGVLVGSARRASYSKMVARAVMEMLPEPYAAKCIEIDRLELFCQDYDDEQKTPSSWAAFRDEIKQCQAFLFVTPEYNRSYPPLLKNALDIASRPFGMNAWQGKPGAIIGVSPGKFGGFGACHHLRQSLSFLDIYMLQQPEVYIGGVDKLFDGQGALIDEGTKAFLQKFTAAYIKWITLTLLR